MARMGRPRKAANLKLVQGTYRPDRDKRVKPAETKGRKCPSPPSYLGRVAKLEWRRIAPDLFRKGLLASGETATLAAYCQAFARWREFDQVVTEQGPTFTTEKGYVCQRPEVTLAQKEREAMVKYASYFGLNPSDRIATDENPTADPDAEFLLGERTGS